MVPAAAMYCPSTISFSSFFFFLVAAQVATNTISFTGVEAVVGVNYGMKGGNLPPPDKVVSLYKSRHIQKLRLFHPDATVLTALENSGIEVVLGTLNEDLPRLASNGGSYAANWVATNVVPHAKGVKFRYVTAGNEVIPGELARHVLPAMRNIDAAIRAAGLDVPVTTAVGSNVLGASYPPSQGVFSQAAAPFMGPIATYLAYANVPLLVNVYPYFAYSGNVGQVRLDYALFKADTVVVRDGSLGYTNLFDAMVDSIYAALEKVGAAGVEVVVSETGWPSDGDGTSAATIENAMTYNNNAVAHASSGSGTPRRPGRAIETYLFAMFNEDQKPGAATERHFGLYHPDMTEVYHVDFHRRA